MKKFNVTGMSCAACSSRVERAVSKLEGVENCSVNLLTGLMSVEGSITAEEVILAVEKAGYGANEVRAKAETENDKSASSSVKET